MAQQVWQTAKFIRREMMNRRPGRHEEKSAIWDQLNDVEESAINPVAEDGNELAYDHKTWDDFVKNRKGSRERARAPHRARAGDRAPAEDARACCATRKRRSAKWWTACPN